MANALTKESAGQLFVVATMMATMQEGGLHSLGQKNGEYLRFVLAQHNVDLEQFEDLLQESLEDACAMLPRYVKAKAERKRTKRS